MRTKIAISDNFVAINRHFIKKDIESTEAIIQALAIVAECCIDVRTNLARLTVLQFPEENKEQTSKLQNVN